MQQNDVWILLLVRLECFTSFQKENLKMTHLAVGLWSGGTVHLKSRMNLHKGETCEVLQTWKGTGENLWPGFVWWGRGSRFKETGNSNANLLRFIYNINTTRGYNLSGYAGSCSGRSVFKHGNTNRQFPLLWNTQRNPPWELKAPTPDDATCQEHDPTRQSAESPRANASQESRNTRG